MGAGKQIFKLPFQIQESIPHPTSLPRLLQRSQGDGCGFWVPRDTLPPAGPTEKHLEKRRDLSGPAPFPAPIVPAKRTAHLTLGLHTHPPTLRGVGKQKGGWMCAFPRRGSGNWTRRGTGTAQEAGAGHCLTAGGCGTRLWGGGQPDTSSLEPRLARPARGSQKSEPGQPRAEAEAPAGPPAPRPREEAPPRGRAAGELAGAVRAPAPSSPA